MVGLFIISGSCEHSPHSILHLFLSVRDASTLDVVRVLSPVTVRVRKGSAAIFLRDQEWLAEVEQDPGLLILVPDVFYPVVSAQKREIKLQEPIPKDARAIISS